MFSNNFIARVNGINAAPKTNIAAAPLRIPLVGIFEIIHNAPTNPINAIPALTIPPTLTFPNS
ncbi:MAG: hypothetical protein H8E13_14160 [Actinobacteria bacterium]|nr:hypothetical protein [Actinomycetota bacterium]